MVTITIAGYRCTQGWDQQDFRALAVRCRVGDVETRPLGVEFLLAWESSDKRSATDR